MGAFKSLHSAVVQEADAYFPHRYASEVDVDFVRKAVRSIGRLAIKIPSSADRAITALLSLIETKVSYVVQEAIVVIKDIFRRYPNQYESIIGTLCENLDVLDEPEAKAAMIWIIGQYADRIENSDELLDDFLYTFLEESNEVQLALLTATVKLFIRRPTAGQELVPKVLKMATEEVENPDLRDRVRRATSLLANERFLILLFRASCTGACFRRTLRGRGRLSSRTSRQYRRRRIGWTEACLTSCSSTLARSLRST